MTGGPEARRRSSLLAVTRAVVIGVATCVAAAAASAQGLTPRTYWPAPNGIGVIVLGYVYAEGDVLIDPTLPLYGVDSEVSLAVVGYLQTFSLWGRTANILAQLPYQWSTTSGFLVETPAEGSVSGFGDPEFKLTVNLSGAPAMTPAEFQALRDAPHPILGASVTVIVPIGEYDPNRVLNASGNRWAVRGGLGYIIPLRPKLLLEIEGGIWWLGDDDEFVAGRREQEPIAGIQLHLVRRFKPGFWASLDANYFFGGRQTIDGRQLVDVQQNSRIGGTVVVPFKGRHAVKVGFATGIFTEFGTDLDQVLVSYQVLFR